jgi:hypothetical protein
MQANTGLETLLDLNGYTIDQEGGYWIKVEAWGVPVTADIPHGIRYSLTLHEPYGKRILGYDNSHAIKPPKKFKFAGQRLPYDHKTAMWRIRVSPMSSRTPISYWPTSSRKWIA